jgi:dTDP-4-dehydrorhamnose reductase
MVRFEGGSLGGAVQRVGMNGPILVFGARGQIGRELMGLAGARRIPIVGLSRADANITDDYAVRAAVDIHRAAAVVNAAGYTVVDRAERDVEAATIANVTGPAVLAAACSDAGVPLIHLSSAYVFDGAKKGAYVETDRIAPLNVQGRTKAEGEAMVRERTKRHVILRSSWIYGFYGRNFLRTTLRLAIERDELRMVKDQFGCPTATVDLAEAILVTVRKLAEKPGTAGTFHFAGAGRTSWYGFAEEIVRRQAFFTERAPKVTAILSAEYPSAAKRPANCELDSSRFFSTFGFRARPWQERVGEVVAQLMARSRSADAKAADAKAGDAKEQVRKTAGAKPDEPKQPDPQTPETAS